MAGGAYRCLDPDLAGLFQDPRERQGLAVLERAGKPDQHDVLAAGRQFGVRRPLRLVQTDQDG